MLVNNAGYGHLTAFEEGDEEGYRAQFETNMFGLIAMIKSVLPGMRERGGGAGDRLRQRLQPERDRTDAIASGLVDQLVAPLTTQ